MGREGVKGGGKERERGEGRGIREGENGKGEERKEEGERR